MQFVLPKKKELRDRIMSVWERRAPSITRDNVRWGRVTKNASALWYVKSGRVCKKIDDKDMQCLTTTKANLKTQCGVLACGKGRMEHTNREELRNIECG
jgi:hypothetical protein